MLTTVTEARKRWSELLDRVERGERVSVSRRGKVVATFWPERDVASTGTVDGKATTGRAAQTE
jgi:antitoxin (DNA-binding transcriptional repressor) of toxin-antitoxin stability system